MRAKIIIILLLKCFLTHAQKINFVDNNNRAIENVSIQFSLNGEKKLLFSKKNGQVYLSNFDANFKISISHLSYKSLEILPPKKDTILVLDAKNVVTDEIFVTGQIKPTKKSNTIQKVKLISRNEIESRAANNLEELLRKEVNMRLTNDNILGSSTSIQGISGQNVKILIDDVPVIGRLNGNIDLSQINLNNVDRVEIIEGPLSTDYGTDALAGTINIITRKNSNKKYTSNYNLYYESVGKYNTDMSHLFNVKNHFFSIDLGRKYFDGWKKDEKFTLFPNSQVADSNRVKSWNPKEQYFGKIQYNNKYKKNTTRIFFNTFHEKITNLGPPRLPYYETAFDDYYFTIRNDLVIDYNLNTKNYNLRFISSFNNYKRIKNTYFKDLVNLNQSLTNNNSDQDTSIFNLIMNKLIFSSFKSSEINYQIGIDSKIEYTKGKRINQNKKNINDYSIFVSSNWNPNKYLQFKPALRFSYNSIFNVPIIPSFNMMIKNNLYKVRFSYAKGFRSPSLKELYYEFVDINHNIIGNSNLTSENSNNFQVNLDYEKKMTNYKFEHSFRLFYNDINNLITLAKSTESEIYTYFNLGKYKTKGISTNVNFSKDNLKVNFSASNISRYNSLSENSNISEFSSSESFNYSINYIFPKYYLTTSFYYNYFGKLPVFYKNNFEEIVESEIDSYSIIDFIMQKEFLSGKINFKIGVKNILNVQEIESISNTNVHSTSSNIQSIGYGRTFFTSFKIKL